MNHESRNHIYAKIIERNALYDFGETYISRDDNALI